MQRLEGLLRKAVQDYEMIAPGDRVCVGVSGGKDSVALTVALGHLRRYLGVPFEVMAVTLDPRFGGVEADYGARISAPWYLITAKSRTPARCVPKCGAGHCTLPRRNLAATKWRWGTTWMMPWRLFT